MNAPDTGRCFSWGWNGHGQVGVGSSVSVIPSPRLVQALDGLLVTQVAAGLFHTLFLTGEWRCFPHFLPLFFFLLLFSFLLLKWPFGARTHSCTHSSMHTLVMTWFTCKQTIPYQ